MRIWDLKNGNQLFKFQYREPCRATALSLGDELSAVTTDAFSEELSNIHIVRLSCDLLDQKQEDVLRVPVDRQRITRIFFHDINHQLITSHEDGSIRRWDVETGKQIQRKQVHQRAINDLKFSGDGIHLITASTDKTSKLIDAKTFQTINLFQTERSVNSADISPIFQHVVLGGGQEAALVTTTSARAGKFESLFYHKIFAKHFGIIRGHFGPINTVAFRPDGTSFCSGSEDGYVRIHHFDKDYFETTST